MLLLVSVVCFLYLSTIPLYGWTLGLFSPFEYDE